MSAISRGVMKQTDSQVPTCYSLELLSREQQFQVFHFAPCRLLLALGGVDNAVCLCVQSPGGHFQQVSKLTGHGDWIRALAFTSAPASTAPRQLRDGTPINCLALVKGHKHDSEC